MVEDKSGTDLRSDQTKALIPLLLINFIGVLGFSIVLPFLVFLVERFGGNAFIYGLLGAMYPAFQFIGAPILGRWSDSIGRKRILILSQLGTLFSWILFLIALFLPVTLLREIDSAIFGTFLITLPIVTLFLARAFDGLTGGNISVANAYLADITAEKDRNRNFGRMSISSNLGFIVGPALAGILGATIYGEVLPVIAALVISVVGLGIILAWLPKTHVCALEKPREGKGIRRILGMEHRDCSDVRIAGRLSFRAVLGLDYIPFMLLLYFLIFLGFNIFYTSFPIHAIIELEWSIADLGIFLSALSLVMVLVQGPVLSRASERYSESRLIIAGNLILGTGFVLLTSGNILVIYAAAALFAIGNGIMWPSVLSLLSKIAGKEHQGAIQGFSGSAGSLASIIGLISGGIIYGIAGSITFLISAVIIYFVFILSFRLITIERRRFSGLKSQESAN